MYIANHNAPSITDFVEFLSIECVDAGLKPIISHQLLPDAKNIIIECFGKGFNKDIKKIFSKNDPRLVLIATEIVKDGLLNSTEPGAVRNKRVGTILSQVLEERSKYFFDIVDYFGTIVCVSEEIMIL